MIKIVSFDIGGTLIKDNIVEYSIKDLAKLVNKDIEIVKRYYKEIFQRDKGNFDYLVNKFCKSINYDRDIEIDNFFRNKFNDYSKISSEGIDTIKRLYMLGYKIILVSNSCCLIKNTISDEILEMISKSYYSYDYGYTKEDNELYKIISSDLNVKPDEILHIGDTYKSDYLIPRMNGFKTLFYGKTEMDIDKIDNLLEIIDYLDKETINSNC